MAASVARFRPFEDAELRIRVTVELLDDAETFDCLVVHAKAAAELSAGPELKAVERARQLLAVASHSLAN